MRFARVIGRVTLSMADPAYTGSRLLLSLPCLPDAVEQPQGQPLPKGDSLVIYDTLGAGPGDLIGYTDGGEAAAPFASPTPCDAFNAAIFDSVQWQPKT